LYKEQGKDEFDSIEAPLIEPDILTNISTTFLDIALAPQNKKDQASR
jgi:hypothetical protein